MMAVACSHSVEIDPVPTPQLLMGEWAESLTRHAVVPLGAAPVHMAFSRYVHSDDLVTFVSIRELLSHAAPPRDGRERSAEKS